jgi:hypothetical protein
MANNVSHDVSITVQQVSLRNNAQQVDRAQVGSIVLAVRNNVVRYD